MNKVITHIIENRGTLAKGTMIFTHIGFKPIEKLRAGDLVVFFNRNHKLDHGVVLAIHINSTISQLIRFYNNDKLLLECTQDYQIFDRNSASQFKEAVEFNVGEQFEDWHGNNLEITNIEVISDVGDIKTYGLTVEGGTFIANNIKVHNGGGKGGSGSATFNEDPDSLQSNAIIRIQDVLSEGPIVGAVNGLKSIFFNGTALRNSDNSDNFSNVTFNLMVGSPDQNYMPGFPAVEDDTTINTEITFVTSVTHDISTSGIDAARITIQLPNGLNKTFSDSSGSGIKGSTVTLAIDTKSSTGSFTEILRFDITGKASSVYETSYRVEKPTGATLWSVRVRRLTADSTSATLVNKTVFARCTEIQDVKEQYDNTAYVGTTISAKSVGNAVPQRSFDIKGLLVPVPINYDPITRSYTGSWDGGTFQMSWTDNPAWIILEMIRNTRWGVGDIDDSIIDFMSFYNASQYNDALVSDGNGGTEPRFTFNYQIMNRSNDWTLIQQMASNSRCVISSNPLVVMYQDRPGSTVKLITNANVIDGLFTYSGSAGGTRFTQANVTYNDKNNKYLPKVITYQDNNAIVKYGQNSSDIQAYGCTSEGQARRLATYVVETNLNSTDTVTYSCGISQMDLQPFDIIEIMDNDYVGNYFAGIIQGGTLTQLILDRTIPLKPGKTYNIKVLGADGSTIQQRTIASTGNITTATLFTALPAGNDGNTLAGRVFIIQSPADISARQFRVVNIKETAKGIFEVTATFYDPNKYSFIETGIAIPAPIYSTFDGSTIPRPANVTFAVEQYVDVARGNRVEIHVRWDQVTAVGFSQYVFQWRVNQGVYSAPVTCTTNDFQILDAKQGDYDVIIRSELITGAKSAPTTASFSYVATGQNTLNPPINLQLAAGTGTGLIFTTADLSFTWSAPITNNVGLAGYQIKIYNNDANAQIYTANVDAKTLAYTFTNALNTASNGGPFRHLRVEVYSKDVQGLISFSSANAVFSNPPPAIPAIHAVPATKSIGVFIDPPAETDFAGIVVWVSQTKGYIPDATTMASATAGLSTTVSALDGPNYIHVAAYDTFGTTGLLISGELEVDVTDFTLYVQPDVPSNLAVTAKLVTATDGGQTASVTATWTADAANVSTYTLRIRDISTPTGFSYVTVTDVSYTFVALRNSEEYGISVRADNVHVSSQYCTELTVVTPVDNVGPDAPSGLVATPAFRNIFLSWTLPTNPDLAGTEIWFGTNNNRANALVLAREPSDAFTHSGLITGQTYYYWIRCFDTSDNFSGYFPASPLNGISATPIQTTAADYQNLSIVTAAIADAAIDDAKIANATITNAKIANATITTAQIANGTITSANIAAATITSANIQVGTITSANIGDAQINTVNIKAGAITAAVIQDATIITAKIATGAIQTAQIANGTITSANIANGTILDANIAAASITGAKIGTATISSANIADGNITNAKIAHAAVDTLTIAGNAVTVPTSAFTGAIVNTINNGQSLMQQFVHTASGSPIYLSYSQITTLIGGGATGAGNVTFTLNRGNTTIYTAVVNRVGGTTHLDSFSLTDIPPAATYTYQLIVGYVQTATTLGLISSLNSSARSLVAIETKR